MSFFDNKSRMPFNSWKLMLHVHAFPSNSFSSKESIRLKMKGMASHMITSSTKPHHPRAPEDNLAKGHHQFKIRVHQNGNEPTTLEAIKGKIRRRCNKPEVFISPVSDLLERESLEAIPCFDKEDNGCIIINH